ncbi:MULTISPECIES: oligosaccharide flippase family protein [Gemella]|uniref:oligosaccharide flippase family protein n=1 Tax=Gemella TaxID=1378 RepID=UPI0007684B93|nr:MULTISPECIES: oligosaccharide flippase family protein [Gemella]AME08883.1 polysaccharide biosynthesis protein [Gemella sp. oral taxon 928]AXI26455.1 flippase [Gemella sp. ND 6198]
MKLLKNYLYNVSYQLLNIILPIITVPYVTRVFTSENLGNYGFYNSIVSYFVLLANLGINIYGTKQIASSTNVNKTFWNIYAIQVTTSIVSILLYCGALNLVPTMNNKIAVLLVISLFSKLLDISWLFTGREDFKRITIRNASVRLLGVISIFLFIKNENQIYLYVFILVIFDFLGQLIMWFPAREYIRKPEFRWDGIKKNIKPTILLFLPQIAISLYVVMDRTLLGIFGSFYDVGIYDQSQKLISILLTIVSSLGAVMLPRVANLLAEKKEKEALQMVEFSFLVYNVIIFPMIFGLMVINELFVNLFLGENFGNVKYSLYIISFNILFIGWTNILGYQVLVVRNKNKEFMLSTTIPAIVSILINIALIPLLGYIGASITSVIVEFLVFILQWNYSRKIVDIRIIFNNKFIKILFSTIIMFIVIELLKVLVGLSNIIGLVMYILVGGMVYISLILYLKVIDIKELREMIK